VVLCKEIPDQIDNTYMGIYAGISSDNIRNLHIVLADSPEPVEVCCVSLYKIVFVIWLSSYRMQLVCFVKGGYMHKQGLVVFC
jgi:hypothetical protein